MKHYRKMVAAVVGVVVIQANHWTGVDYSAAAPLIIDALVSLGLVLGVWSVPNDAHG